MTYQYLASLDILVWLAEFSVFSDSTRHRKQDVTLNGRSRLEDHATTRLEIKGRKELKGKTLPMYQK